MQIDSVAEQAYDHIFETGHLWLDLSDGAVAFEFTDNNFEYRKCFSIDHVQFCGVEDDKAVVIAALKRLIDRVEAGPEP